MPANIKATLRDNVLALLRHHDGELRGNESGVSRLVKRGFALGTAQRVLGGQTSVGLDIVAELAEAFGVQPWQLLTPGLQPGSPPGLTADPTAWPFEMVDRSGYAALLPEDRAYVQGSLDNAITARLAARAGNRRRA